MTQINAYLTFNGNCREVMTFYQFCLGGELVFHTIEGSPMEARCPSAIKHQILHSSLTKGPLLLMATDMIGPEGYKEGNTIAMSLNCSSEEEIKTFYNNLSAGGKVLMSVEKTFWATLFAEFTDKYGIRWMLNYDENQNQ